MNKNVLRIKQNNGFTLIELVIVIFIIAVLAAVVAPLMIQGIDSWLTIRDQEIILSRARLAMNRIMEELRFDCVAITNDNDEQIQFTNSPASGGDTIFFYVATDLFDPSIRHLCRLNQTAGTPRRILARNVAHTSMQDALQVSYFEENGAPYTSGNLDDIRFISFRIIFRSDTFPDRQYVFGSGVAPRLLQ